MMVNLNARIASHARGERGELLWQPRFAAPPRRHHLRRLEGIPNGCSIPLLAIGEVLGPQERAACIYRAPNNHGIPEEIFGRSTCRGAPPGAALPAVAFQASWFAVT